MRIVMMNGGLGNQAFQYIFLRFLELATKEQCVIDDLFFFDNPPHNGYELDRVFSICHPRLSESLDANVIKEMVQLTRQPSEPGRKPRGLIPVFKNCGIDLFPIQEGNYYLERTDYHGSIFTAPLNEFYPDILRFQGDLYYYGYWINARWFRTIMDTILKEFVFPPLMGSGNQDLMKEIQTCGEKSVAVHIRRGDFVTLGWEVSPQWYQEAFAVMRRQIEQPVFFIFSDDIPWVMENQEALGILPEDRVIFAEGNTGKNSYIDMQLMSACRGMIIANSSFSYLAALLNRRPDKLVCNPTQREIL